MEDPNANQNIDDPDEWKSTVESLLTDMDVKHSDYEAINLISLIMQQETLNLLKSTIEQTSNLSKQVTNKQRISTTTDARIACQDHLEESYIHPHLIEDNIRGLTRLINSQPLPDSLQDPSLCSSLNLSAPTWKLADDVINKTQNNHT